MAVPLDLQLVSELTTLEKRIRKLHQIWTKYKRVPRSLDFLAKDLTLLVATILPPAPGDIEYQRLLPVVIVAIRECVDAIQDLVNVSGKYTSKFNRKPMDGDALNSLESSFTDIKIRLLLVQFLLDRREASTSHTAVAEELAQLHVRTVPRVSFEKLKLAGIEPKADSLLSFKCYSEMVGRETLLFQLDEEMDKTKAVLLTGAGGIGKTQIAAEYAMRFQNRQSDSQVFWVDCETSASLEASYWAIAENLKIPGLNDCQTGIIEKTKRYLDQDRGGQWLMILHNASPTTTDWELSSGFTSLGPSQYPSSLGGCLPSSSKGRILCISCDTKIADQLPGNPSILCVPPLHEVEATSLFHSKIPKELDSSASASQLAMTLKYLPLAICQAAAYMVATRCDASGYLSLLEAAVPVHNQSTTQKPTVAHGLSEPCYKTTLISYNSIQKQNTQASDLLSLIAVCHGRSISKTVLWSAWNQGISTLMTTSNVPDLDISKRAPSPDRVPDSDYLGYIGFSTALATLEAYLMVQYDAVNETYSMHRVVRSAVLSILQQQNTILTWQSSAMVLFSSTSHTFRLPIKQSGRIISDLMVHISQVVRHSYSTVDAELAKAKVLCDAARFKISLMQPKESTILLQDAFRIQKRLLKAQDTRLLRTLLSLAESTSHSDSPAIAVPLFIQAIAGYKQTLGPGHRRTLFAQISLCSNYITSGDAEAASTVLYEAQAAASASLQIPADDKRKIQQRLDDLKVYVAVSKQRQSKGLKYRSKGLHGGDKLSQGPLNACRPDRKHMLMRAFSANNRVASLDSIVEIFEVDPGRS